MFEVSRAWLASSIIRGHNKRARVTPGLVQLRLVGLRPPGSSSRSGSGIGLHAAFEQSGELNFHRRKEFVIKVGNALLQGTEMRANSGGIARSIPEQRYIQERGPQPCARLGIGGDDCAEARLWVLKTINAHGFPGLCGVFCV